MNIVDPAIREGIHEFFGESPNDIEGIQFSQIEPTVTVTYGSEPVSPEYYRQFSSKVDGSTTLCNVSGPLMQDDGTYETLLRVETE